MLPGLVNNAARQAERQPTDAQKEAGNYRKGHAVVHGLDITVENARGSERSGTTKSGKRWSVTVPAHYGYIKGTEGADGDHLDVYLGPDIGSELVFVIDQADCDTGRFDEHKAMLGFPDRKAAVSTYERGFSDGKGSDRIAAVTAMSVEDFKKWAMSRQTSKPAAERRGYAHGGAVGYAAGGTAPWFVRNKARGMFSHTGPLNSPIGGRTDHLPVNVPSGSYVMPADTVSALGQGNTANGTKIMDSMFKSGPYGMAAPKIRSGSGITRARRAEGGPTEGEGDDVPILAAGGEYIVHPESVAQIGGGDIDHGHAVLDAFVKHIRDQNIKTLRRLPGPAKD